jgi:hypothetical protein
MDANLNHGDDMPVDLLSKTDWKDSMNPLLVH